MSLWPFGERPSADFLALLFDSLSEASREPLYFQDDPSVIGGLSRFLKEDH